MIQNIHWNIKFPDYSWWYFEYIEDQSQKKSLVFFEFYVSMNENSYKYLG